MSRAYRIKVRETLRRVIRAEDHVESQLELLQVLPQAEMGELLAAELEKEGFQRRGGQAVREREGITVSVELDSGTVTVQSSSDQQVEVSDEKEGRYYDDMGPSKADAQKAVSQQVKAQLEKEIAEKNKKLQQEVTDRLERELSDLRKQLDQAVNRATAEALERRAAQLGEVKSMSEDAESGSLTIVVEV